MYTYSFIHVHTFKALSPVYLRSTEHKLSEIFIYTILTLHYIILSYLKLILLEEKIVSLNNIIVNKNNSIETLSKENNIIKNKLYQLEVKVDVKEDSQEDKDISLLIVHLILKES